MIIHPFSLLLSLALVAAVTISATQPTEEETVTVIELHVDSPENKSDVVQVFTKSSGSFELTSMGLWIDLKRKVSFKRATWSGLQPYLPHMASSEDWQALIEQSWSSGEPQFDYKTFTYMDWAILRMRDWAIYRGGTMTDLEFDPDGTRIEIWTVRQKL